MKLRLLLLLLLPMPVSAQKPVQLREKYCDQCSIRLTKVVDLVGIDSLGGISPAGYLARDRRGRYYHTNYFYPTVIQVFDSTGKVLTTIGRKGAGPGEFNRPEFVVVGSGDTLHIFDGGNRRYTLMSPEYKVVRTAPIASQVTAGAEQRPGRLIVATYTQPRSRFTQPLYFWEGNRLQNGFGRDEALPNGPVQDERVLMRKIAVSADGSIWTARRHEYMLEHWSADGRPLHRLARNVEWFQPYAIDDSFIGGPPRPYVIGINQDNSGRLWVLVSVPNPNWKQALGRGPVVGGRQTTRVASPDPTDVWWTRIEVIDPRTAEVLASSLIRQSLGGFSSDGNVFSPVVDQDGVAIMRVWRLSLTGPPPHSTEWPFQ